MLLRGWDYKFTLPKAKTGALHSSKVLARLSKQWVGDCEQNSMAGAYVFLAEKWHMDNTSWTNNPVFFFYMVFFSGGRWSSHATRVSVGYQAKSGGWGGKGCSLSTLDKQMWDHGLYNINGQWGNGQRIITLQFLGKTLLVKMDLAEESNLFWWLSREDGRSEVMCLEEELPQ